MPVLEAMARGIPVVTSNRSAMPEVAGGAALLVDPFNVEAIADGLGRVMDDNETSERLRLAGLKRAAEFSWEAAVERTWAVYGELFG